MSVFDIFKKLEEEKAAKPVQPIEWIVVGLGNPGSQYDNTRHNAGFRALESYCARSGQKIDRMKFKALAGEGMLGGKRVLFLKPQTFMNLSGEAVRDAAAFYKIPPERVIVLSDDVSLDVGTLRVRPKGSAGGQNGLKNIIYHLGSEDFPRVKIGVGKKPRPDYDLAAWVLGKFPQEEQKAIDKACEDAVSAAACIIEKGCAAAAQNFNGNLFPDRKNRFQRLHHCRTVSVLHPCCKCDQAFFCGLLTAADSMKFFHFGYIKCRFVRKACHISLSFMITVSKGNGHYHSQLNLCFQFFRNSVLKTAVKLFVGYIHNDIRVDHLSALSLSS